MEGSDIVIIAAGFPRSAGMSRLDLLHGNLGVVQSLGANIMSLCPRAHVLVITNPVDVLTCCLKRTWPSMNVFGLGCSLDTLRFRFFIAETLGVSVDSVNGIVIGMHNDMMVPLVKQATAGGIMVTQLMDERSISLIVRRTREAGTAIVEKLKNRSGFYAASNTIGQVVESMVSDKKGIFPLSVHCSGEYGYRDICLALPAITGHGGVERVVEIPLAEDDREALDACARQMREITVGLPLR
jgi:malate dehydrogenase